MKIVHILGENLKSYLIEFNEMKVNHERFSPGIFENFEGFSPIDIDEHKCQFIIATNEEKDVIGVIKLKRYKFFNHEFLSEEDFQAHKKRIKNYKGIMFIDVREDFRKQGVARQMIKHLCDITKEEGTKTSIRLGKLTHLGKEAKLLNIFKEYLPEWDIKL